MVSFNSSLKGQKMARSSEEDSMSTMDRLTNVATNFIKTIDEEIQAASHIKPYVKQLHLLKEKYLLLAATTERYSSLMFVHSLNRKAFDKKSQVLAMAAIVFIFISFGLSIFAPTWIAGISLGASAMATSLNVLCTNKRIKIIKEHRKKLDECMEIIYKTQDEADFIMKTMVTNVIKELLSSATDFSSEDWSPDDDDNDL